MTALLAAAAMFAAAGVVMLTGCGAQRGKGEPAPGPVINGQEAYHVIVAGGEPEGIAAALAAARNGMRTLLVEEGDALGGLMTLGMLNILDMNYTQDRVLLTQGIFKEFLNAVGDAFDIEEAKEWFLQTCNSEPNLTVMLNTDIIGPVMVGNTIVGLEISGHGSNGTIVQRSLAVIDATTDGDVAAAAGAPYTIGGEDRGAHEVKQGVTLVFEVSDVDWAAVREYFDNDGDYNTVADATRARGYTEEAKGYVPIDGDMRFRGPNFARQRNGDVLLNALIIFGVDALDPDSVAEGIERGRRELPNIIEFMRENFVGFENAAYVGHAPRLYVRETRHFIGEYRLTVTDVLENRDHWDRIGHGKYPVDIQPTGPNNVGTVVGVPDIYSIPFRCLVPLEIDQLLIASRSASYDSLAHGSARVLPVGMVTGEASGTAVAYSVENNVSFRQMAYDHEAISWLQNQLKEQGAYLTEYDPPRVAVMDHWAYPGLVVIRELGMAVGGYRNDYQLENDVPHHWMIQNTINRVMKVLSERTEYREGLRIPAWEISLEPDEITLGDLLLAAAECASQGDEDWLEAFQDVAGGMPEPMAFTSVSDARDYLVSRGILDTENLSYFTDFNAVATRGQLYSIVGAMYTTLMEMQS